MRTLIPGKSVCRLARPLVLVAAFSLITIVCSPLIGAEPGSMQVHNLLSSEGIDVLQPHSPGFSEHLAKMLDGSSIQTSSAALSKSIIVINNTGRPLWSLTVVYTYPERLSPAGAPWKYVRSKTAGSHAWMIEPGDEYLFTPVPGLSPGFRAPNERLNVPNMDAGLIDAINRYAEHDSPAAVVVSVDSIIFPDGTLAGPDSADRLTALNSKAKAEREVLDAVADLHGDELRRQLIFYASLNSGDLFAKQRRDYAMLLLRAFTDDGETASRELIKAFHDKKQIEHQTETISRKTP